MEKVASHINEMQKIYEDYGCVFDQLAAEQSGRDKQVRAHTHTHTQTGHNTCRFTSCCSAVSLR